MIQRVTSRLYFEYHGRAFAVHHFLANDEKERVREDAGSMINLDFDN